MAQHVKVNSPVPWNALLYFLARVLNIPLFEATLVTRERYQKKKEQDKQLQFRKSKKDNEKKISHQKRPKEFERFELIRPLRNSKVRWMFLFYYAPNSGSLH